MSAVVNFSSLSSINSISNTDQLLVRLDNSLSGSSGFGRITRANLLGSVEAGNLTIFRQISSTTTPNASTNTYALSVNSLSANVDFALVAKGTGATLAQIPTNTTTGGNKRGIYATDFQKLRSNANEVASGPYGVIGGGSNNKSTSDYTIVGGGYSNTASGQYGAVLGGVSNTSNGNYATVGGGFNNNSGGSYSTVGGGYYNTALERATIPGGYGAYAGRPGQYAYATSFFAGPGDGQHVQYVLYGTSSDTNSVVLTYDHSNLTPGDSGIPSLLVPSQSMAGIFTIQVIGYDDSQNISQGIMKVVIRKSATNSYNEELLVNTSIGTHSYSAGGFSAQIDSGGSEQIVTIVGSSNSLDVTRWVAHVSGVWVYEPPAYP